MDLLRELPVPASAERVFGLVGDLDEYPAWMPLIGGVQRLDDAPTWTVLLQAQVGPFTRSKRLRMARTVHEPPRRAVFERQEVDGREHAMWRLTSTVVPDGTGHCVLQMGLLYSGRLWGGPVLERVLDGQIADASERLVQLVSAEG